MPIDMDPALATSLDRFLVAQDAPAECEACARAGASTFDHALAEIMDGAKLLHWMWFIFPQLQGLGHSERSQYYGIRDSEEAAAYLAHPVLGPRLVECVEEVEAALDQGDTLAELFGAVDALKFVSSMELFSRYSDRCRHVLARVCEPLPDFRH